jgi:hypothetical protein
MKRKREGRQAVRRRPTQLEERMWPEGYVESFAGVSDDLKRPPQGRVETRERFVIQSRRIAAKDLHMAKKR